MAEEELKIQVNRNPDAPVKPSLLAAREDNQRFSATLDEARGRAQAKLSEQPVAGHAERDMERPELPPEEPEPVELLEVELPNGRVVEFGPPTDVCLTMKVIRLLGDMAGEQLTNRLYKILLSVRSVDGVPTAPLTNSIEADKLANKIGDEGLNVLAALFTAYWPPAKITDLKILKKNLRK